ncbi:hypothetical protein BDZ89DRAFT_1080295 [Hymenopellis radicata]|nr:hypothetical protein BDZ89DRAFT_1080295 [Hymenopellis radicata]
MAWRDGDWLTSRLMALTYGRPNYPRIWRTKCGRITEPGCAQRPAATRFDSARGSVRLSMLRSFFESASGPCYVHSLKPLSSSLVTDHI